MTFGTCAARCDTFYRVKKFILGNEEHFVYSLASSPYYNNAGLLSGYVVQTGAMQYHKCLDDKKIDPAPVPITILHRIHFYYGGS